MSQFHPKQQGDEASVSFDSEDRSQQPAQMPLIPGMMGDATAEGMTLGEDLATPSRGGLKQVLGNSTMLLGVVIAIAGASIWLMRVGPAEGLKDDRMAEFEARIEDTLSKLSQPDALPADDPLRRENMDRLFENSDSFVALFSADHTEKQVPLEFIQKNPFLLAMVRTQAVPDNSAQQQAAQEREAQRQAAEAERQLQAELKSLRLKTVMRGRIPVAIINDTFLKPGQTIGSFTVESVDVETLSVVLRTEQRRFRLRINDDGQVNTTDRRLFRPQ